MTKTARKLLIIFGIVLVFGALWLLISSDSNSTVSEDDEYVAGAETAQETERVLSNIQRIRELRLDTTLFSDNGFKSLKDFTVNIADVRTGRTNPFEPVVD
ncbi:MAG: hypothetical protein NUW00_01350 [Candidatus Kaiserbacteria bacterium]|nr:hypothetical protein [Candidatus Kaiserbacteria bacterium]